MYHVFSFEEEKFALMEGWMDGYIIFPLHIFSGAVNEPGLCEVGS